MLVPPSPPQSRNSVLSQNFLSRTVSCLRKKRPITLGRESCEEIFIGCNFLLVVEQSQWGCVFFSRVCSLSGLFPRVCSLSVANFGLNGSFVHSLGFVPSQSGLEQTSGLFPLSREFWVEPFLCAQSRSHRLLVSCKSCVVLPLAANAANNCFLVAPSLSWSLKLRRFCLYRENRAAYISVAKVVPYLPRSKRSQKLQGTVSCWRPCNFGPGSLFARAFFLSRAVCTSRYPCTSKYSTSSKTNLIPKSICESSDCIFRSIE